MQPSAVAYLGGGLWLHHTLTNGADCRDALTLLVPCTCHYGYVPSLLEDEADLQELHPTGMPHRPTTERLALFATLLSSEGCSRPTPSPDGLPVHIAARILGHKTLTTTQAWLAVFQDDLVRIYRGFLDRRRAERPKEEYREPTAAQWHDFQQHFELRKVSLGTCGRLYGTPCKHEHACLTKMILKQFSGTSSAGPLAEGDEES
ncbi:hypothetical protein ACIRPN_16825 [Streptomyces sp. NPDC101230]|uniref:hypothetical protein n=1 Tax=unclassified Streptomyces TaxID=2593676 RepID=UPI00382502A0